MSKRKRETADEQLAFPERHRDAKKQRTKTTASKAVSKHPETEGSAQVQDDRKRKKIIALRLAKRKRKAQKSQQRNELRRKDGVKKGEHDGDTRMVGVQEKRLPKKNRAESSKNGFGNQELGNKDGPQSRKKHKSKKEKRKEKNVQSDGKKSKKEAVEIETWKISDPLGGQMLDLDSVFSPDEK